MIVLLNSFVVELDNVEGISVDWIGNNLYWTNDGYRKTISVARLDRASQTRKTLLEGNMSHPRAIVVDPLNRSENIILHEQNSVGKTVCWYCAGAGMAKHQLDADRL